MTQGDLADFSYQQAYLNPSDSDENEGRKLACEALARKLVARIPMQDQYSLLSARFTVIEEDGDESLPLSGEYRPLSVERPFDSLPKRREGMREALLGLSIARDKYWGAEADLSFLSQSSSRL